MGWPEPPFLLLLVRSGTTDEGVAAAGSGPAAQPWVQIDIGAGLPLGRESRWRSERDFQGFFANGSSVLMGTTFFLTISRVAKLNDCGSSHNSCPSKLDKINPFFIDGRGVNPPHCKEKQVVVQSQRGSGTPPARSHQPQ